MSSRRVVFAAMGVSSAFAIAAPIPPELLPSKAELLPSRARVLDGPCKSCKPQVGGWDWKANGYAVADTEQAVKTAAVDHALGHGCRDSYKYLDAMKLKCPNGCSAGQEARECKPKSEPGCSVGNYQLDKDMWTFVCRKAKGAGAKTGCDATAGAAAPFFSMCDVPIKATATLACSDPNCPS